MAIFKKDKIEQLSASAKQGIYIVSSCTTVSIPNWQKVRINCTYQVLYSKCLKNVEMVSMSSQGRVFLQYESRLNPISVRF